MSPYDQALRAELREHVRLGKTLTAIAAHYKLNTVDMARQFRRLGIPVPKRGDGRRRVS